MCSYHKSACEHISPLKINFCESVCERERDCVGTLHMYVHIHGNHGGHRATFSIAPETPFTLFLKTGAS